MIIMVDVTRKAVRRLREKLDPQQLYVTADLLILTVWDGRLNLLLSRRVREPWAGCWALPGCFLGQWESAEEAARRLLEEMLPGSGAFLEQLYTFTAPQRDPRGRVLSVAHLAVLPRSRLEPLLAASPFQRFRVSLTEGRLLLHSEDGPAPTAEELAFDHGDIIATGIRRLRGKIDYTDIGFRFLDSPASFSLGELQTVFEAVLDQSLDSSNFRRGILSRYEGRLLRTEQTEKRSRGRPAALYRFSI